MSPECAQAAGIGPALSLERANRTRFPFFSDVKGDHRLVLSAVETVVLALIFAVSLLGNVCALVLVARRRRRGTTASLVLNLFCADLLFTSAIPPVLAVRWTEAWLLGPGACHLLFYVMTLSGSVTILTLAAVSLERMVCIVRLQRGVRGTGRRARAALLVLIWGYSAIAALPLCIFFRVVPQRFSGADEEIPICTLVWPSLAGEISWDVSFVTLNFLVPGLLIVISYSKILQLWELRLEGNGVASVSANKRAKHTFTWPMSQLFGCLLTVIVRHLPEPWTTEATGLPGPQGAAVWWDSEVRMMLQHLP
eukprot:XP_007107189.1 free fatty acid receptor 4 isoform X3 [Physeter catodon]